MITKNKLAGYKNTRTLKQFKTKNAGSDKGVSSKGDKGRKCNLKKNKILKNTLFLLGLLFLVASVTFGIIALVGYSGNNDAPADEIPPIDEDTETSAEAEEVRMTDDELSILPITKVSSANPTIKYGRLMLINPNYMVDVDFIAGRKNELVSLSETYGISELHSYNGDNLLDEEAAAQLANMVADYEATYPEHTLETVSCFRPEGTNCGRLCMPTGASDHHTGLTCDLIDPAYGESLDTSTYADHLEWQWLKANSYKYGFIDRFPEAWAGGSMDEPMNLTADGSTGLYETWHYRYVGAYAARQIVTGVYNNGEYDSLEHYLRARGLVVDLLNGN